MKRLVAAAMLALALPGCATNHMLADFEVEKIQVTLIVVEASTVSSICEVISNMPGTHQRGCSRWSKDKSSCEIYVTAPRSVEDRDRFATIGHEVWHCFRGHFH